MSSLMKFSRSAMTCALVSWGKMTDASGRAFVLLDCFQYRYREWKLKMVMIPFSVTSDASTSCEKKAASDSSDPSVKMTRFLNCSTPH